MPEIAEIHLNTDLLLRPFFRGSKDLANIEILSGKYKNKKPDNFDAFVKDLPSKVKSINNRGKFTYIILENNWIIGIGFGMTGRFLLEDTDSNNLRIRLDNSDQEQIWYQDARNFGNWFFWNDMTCLEKKLSQLGIDLIDNDKVSKSKIVESFRRYDKHDISKVLMEQKVLAGVGNYMRAEILYEQKVYPWAKVSNLPDDVLYKIYRESVKLAKLSYKTQKDDFLKKEVHYDSFQSKMSVYNKTHDPLNNKVTQTKNKTSDRTTHWVPSIQTIGK
jgi:formamidopyrimidine-DNA glycosylase